MNHLLERWVLSACVVPSDEPSLAWNMDVEHIIIVSVSSRKEGSQTPKRG